MRIKVWSMFFLILSFSSTNLMSEENKHHDLKLREALENESFSRAIEPTSPVLGYELSTYLKNSEDHPEVVFDELLTSHNLKNDLYRSTNAYLSTLLPELEKYCKAGEVKTLNRDKLTEVEHAAIPVEVLTLLHGDYKKNLDKILNINDDIKLETETLKLANIFQQTRYNCGTAITIRNLENKLELLCLGLNFCQKSKQVNQIVSSAEGAYPRIQYSVNGYTRYVFNELLESNQLKENLKLIFDLETNWLAQTSLQGKNQDSLIAYVLREATKSGMHPKDALLILSFHSRNMPSLDVEYAANPEKALLLEVYFWGFKKIRIEVEKSKYKGKIYPNYANQPGIYHYLTASLLSCEIRLAGINHEMAVTMGYLSKLGYKADKLLKSIDKGKLLKGGFGYIKKLATSQGFAQGVDAGEFGGKFGSNICGEIFDKENAIHVTNLSKIKELYSYDVQKGYHSRFFKDREIRYPLTTSEELKHKSFINSISDERGRFNLETKTLIKE